MAFQAVSTNPAPVATLQPAVGSSVSPTTSALAPASPTGSVFRDAFSGLLNVGSTVLSARVNQIASDELSRHAAQPDFVDARARQNVATTAPAAPALPFGLAPWQIGGLAVAGLLVVLLIVRK